MKYDKNLKFFIRDFYWNNLAKIRITHYTKVNLKPALTRDRGRDPFTTYHWFRALIMPSSFLRFVTTIFLYFKVIKARMENEILWNGQPHLRVRVQRTFKASRVKISSRQLLEKRGQEITCSCGNLRPDRVYVILGKEDRRKRVLYLDNFSTALEWSRNGKTYVRAYRRRSSCPERVE